MKNLLCTMFFIALFIVAGYSTYLIEEHFEGSFPPAGWSAFSIGTTGSGYWQSGSGPWGQLAHGYCQTNEWRCEQLFSCPFNVAAGSTIYFRFDYIYDHNPLADPEDYFLFAIGYPPDPELFSWFHSAYLPSDDQWHVYSSSHVVPDAQSHVLCWILVTDNPFPPYNWSDAKLDNIYVSSTPFVGVSPYSLGCIKATFK
jgi:hypothetical protein